MKKLIFSTLLFISVLAVHAQSEKYIGAMKTNLELLKNAKSSADYSSVSAAFERIGNAEKTLWHPYYYAALSLLRSESEDAKADKDAIGQKVDALLEKAEAIEKNSELSTLHYYNEVEEMTVDPQARYQTSGALMDKYYQQAVAQDSTNPRIYFMKGETVFHTPEAFGGGKSAAKPVFQKAVGLFNNQNEPTGFAPKWGKEDAQKMLDECNK